VFVARDAWEYRVSTDEKHPPTAKEAEMPELRNRRLGKVSITTVIAVVIATAVSTVAIASHTFTDVPDTNTFHEDIAWLADNRVTIGCNPPENTEYCPDENVTREQMAAFMRRLAGTFGAVEDGVTDDSANVSIDGTTAVSLAEIEVTPRAEADVTLNGSVHIAAQTGDANFVVMIAEGDCSGDMIGVGGWTQGLDDTTTNTVSVTGLDTVNADTTYHLCAAKADGGAVNGTAVQRGLTANWVPIY
jgi:hypothetical protein